LGGSRNGDRRGIGAHDGRRKGGRSKTMNLFVRANRQSPLLLAIVSVLLGMLVGAILMVVAGYDPVRAYSALFRTPFTQAFDIGETIRTISPLIMTGLAVAIAFRTGLF